MLDYHAAGLSPTEHWAPFDEPEPGRRRQLYDIVFTPMDIDERNRHISALYHKLDLELRAVLPAGNANWFTFGKWPSRQIGHYLHPERSWVPVVGHLIEGVGRAMAHGNQMVCLDLGEAFDIWLSTVGAHQDKPGRIADGWSECLTQLLVYGPAGRFQTDVLTHFRVMPGAPDPNSGSGLRNRLATQTLDAARTAIRNDRCSAENLILGLECYTAALLTEDPVEQAQRIYAGNVCLAAHEQQALDEVLSAALRLRYRLSGKNGVRRSLTGVPWRSFRMAPRSPRQMQAENLALERYTRTVTFELGDQTINVSEPIRGKLPSALTKSSDKRMVAMKKLGGTEATAAGRTGASDWTRWSERVGVIRRLFGVWHHDALGLEWPAQRLLTPSVPAVPRSVAATGGASIPHGFVELAALARASDGPADDAVLAAPEVGHARALELVSDDVAARVENLRALGLLDESILGQGQMFYERLTVCINLCLQFVSMPEDFTGGIGVRALAANTRQAIHPVRRSAEVGRFLDDVMGTEFWSRETDGFVGIVGVRTMHAAVRQRLVAESQSSHPTWDSEVLGVPLNQEHLLGTALSFFVPVLETLDRLGVDDHRHLRRGYQVTWLTIAHLLGVSLDVLTTDQPTGRTWLTDEQCTELGALFRQRHRRRTIDGVRLTEVLLADLQDHMPNDFTWVPVAMMRALAGDETCDLLLVPTATILQRKFARTAFRCAAAGATDELAELVQESMLRSIDAKRPFRAPIVFADRGPVAEGHSLAPSALPAPTAPRDLPDVLSGSAGRKGQARTVRSATPT